MNIICAKLFRRTLTMETLKLQQSQAEQTVAFLQQQLLILKDLAAQRQKQFEQDEIMKLKDANDKLSGEIHALKKDLRFHEAQNGIKHVPVPSCQSSSSLSSVVQQPPVEAVANEMLKKDETKNQKKASKEPKNKSASKPAKGGDDDKAVDVSRLLMKVGKIIDVSKHPDADSLYVEKVDLGEEKPRTIVSGLVKHITLEQMQNRIAVFICNLKPAKMRGVLSEGMIMCGVNPDVATEIIEVPSSACIGDQVTCEGYTGSPDAQLNPKRKIWEQVQPELGINADGVATYKGAVFTITGKDGKFSVPTVRDCMIR